MPFQKIQAEKISCSITHQIESLILRGVLRPGERLPSERDLSERLGVSRPSLREALSELETRELLVTKANAGVFVAEVLGSAFSPPLIRLFSTHEDALFDYLEFRRDLEGLAAERAARTASDTDLNVIDSVFRQMEVAHEKRDTSKETSLDADFHLSIIEASHNVIMLHMMRSMFDMLREGVFYSRQVVFNMRNKRATLLEQHRAIHAALMDRDPIGARNAVEEHLGFVENALRDQLKLEKNEETARLRVVRAEPSRGK